MISTCISFMTLVKYRRIVLRSLSVQRHDSKEFILNFITDEGDHRYCDVPYYPLIIKRIKDHVFKKLQQYKSQNITLGIDIYDTCGLETKALDSSLKFVMKKIKKPIDGCGKA